MLLIAGDEVELHWKDKAAPPRRPNWATYAAFRHGYGMHLTILFFVLAQPLSGPIEPAKTGSITTQIRVEPEVFCAMIVP
jgi:hypothetical protein